MRAGFGLFLCVCLGFTTPASALDVNLPGQAELVREVDRAVDTYFLPTAPLTQGHVPSRELEGRIVRQAWRISGEDISTLGLLVAIREQIQAQGYDLLLDCTAEECGGFDFRFGIDVLPAPDMFVDLFDFRFLSAQNEAAPNAQYVSALVSLAGDVGYIQLVIAGDNATGEITTATTTATTTTTTTTTEPQTQAEPIESTDTRPSEATLAASLIDLGHAVLSDLVFATGSSTLEDGPYPSLTELAAFLRADPSRRVVLVGHTDAVGALEGNVTLSRARAASVSQRLVDNYEVPQDQLTSEGMGYLAPVASNATEEGRRANRRVEAVLLGAR